MQLGRQDPASRCALLDKKLLGGWEMLEACVSEPSRRKCRSSHKQALLVEPLGVRCTAAAAHLLLGVRLKERATNIDVVAPDHEAATVLAAGHATAMVHQVECRPAAVRLAVRALHLHQGRAAQVMVWPPWMAQHGIAVAPADTLWICRHTMPGAIR